MCKYCEKQVIKKSNVISNIDGSDNGLIDPPPMFECQINELLKSDFEQNKDYEDYFQIAAYESWNNSTNQKLMLAVKKIVGEEENGSVPFIVIGDDYKLMGFGEKSGEEIIKAALKAYQDENYTDIVKKAIKDNNLSPKAETIAQAAKEESISVKDEYTKTDITEVYENHSAKKGLSDGAVIAIVFGVIILGFAGLVVLSRK